MRGCSKLAILQLALVFNMPNVCSASLVDMVSGWFGAGPSSKVDPTLPVQEDIDHEDPSSLLQINEGQVQEDNDHGDPSSLMQLNGTEEISERDLLIKRD